MTSGMAGSALAIVAVLGSLLILAGAFTGIGLLTRRAFGVRALTLDDCFVSFWVGFSTVLLFLILWNFVLPVGLTALLVALAAGALGWIQSRSALRGLFDADAWRPRAWEIGVLLVGMLWIATQCLPAFSSWDGGLYHVQAVKWAKSYAVVPGLANLHGPLGFNNSSFLYDAMVDSGWWEGRGFHLANGVLLLGAVMQALVNGLQWLRGGEWATNRRCFLFITLAPALHMGRDVASYSTDLPMGLVVVSAAALAYALLDRGGAPPGDEDGYRVWALAVLLAGAASIKLTAVIFAAIALPVIIAVRFRHWPRERRGRALRWVAVTLVLFSGAWISRGIVLSGYPFFPVAAAGVPVDWRAAAEHAQLEAAYIAHTEREFTWSMIGRQWLRLMLVDDIDAALVPSGLVIAGALIWWRSRRRAGVVPDARSTTLWLALPLVVAIAVWLMTVPSHRYSPALFWSLAALWLAEAQRTAWAGWSPFAKRFATVALLVIVTMPVVGEPAVAAVRHGGNPARAVFRRNVVRPAASDPLPRLAGSIETHPFETRSGLVLLVPTRQPEGRLPNACANAPLPCTPNPAANLQLRVPGRLDKGFKVSGPWEMLDWPYYWQLFFLPEWRLRHPGATAGG